MYLNFRNKRHFYLLKITNWKGTLHTDWGQKKTPFIPNFPPQIRASILIISSKIRNNEDQATIFLVHFE
jgi:hypothetical protein